MNYQTIYDQIIDRARERNLQGYKEKHHIIPKCLGGSNDRENLAELTAREHFIVHRLLCEIYPKNGKLAFALWRMCNRGGIKQQRDYKITSRNYEIIRNNHAKFLSEALTGVPKPEGFGDRLSEILKGRIGSWTGKVQSAQHAEKRALSRRGKVGNTRTKEVEEKIQTTRRENGSGNKSILQYSRAGEFILEWKSLTLASSSLGISMSSLSSCLSGNQKTAGNFIWKFKKN